MFIDSHAHIDDPRFDEDRDAVLQRAWDAGVRKILTIGNGSGPDAMGCGIPFAEAHDWIYTSVGIHPHDAQQVEERHYALTEGSVQRIRRSSRSAKPDSTITTTFAARYPTGGLPCASLPIAEGAGFAGHRPHPGCGFGYPDRSLRRRRPSAEFFIASRRATGSPTSRWVSDSCISFSGIVTFPNCWHIWSRRRGGFLPTGFWWKRIVHISPRCRIAEDAMSRHLSQTRCAFWHRCGETTPEQLAAQTTANFEQTVCEQNNVKCTACMRFDAAGDLPAQLSPELGASRGRTSRDIHVRK